MKKITFSNVKDIIYIVTIIIGVIFWYRDKIKNDTIQQEQMKTVQKNQEEILKTLHEHDNFWIKQQEINGRVTMYITLDSQ